MYRWVSALQVATLVAVLPYIHGLYNSRLMITRGLTRVMTVR